MPEKVYAAIWPVLEITSLNFPLFFKDSEVKCLWCNTVLNEWEYGDQVMARHRSANPDCPFIRNISDNVPLLANR